MVLSTQPKLLEAEPHPNSLCFPRNAPANCVGSSRLKPDVRREVSNNNQIKSFTVLSDLSAAAFFFNSVIIECFGLISIVFFRHHVRSHRAVSESLCLHDPLHVC